MTQTVPQLLRLCCAHACMFAGPKDPTPDSAQLEKERLALASSSALHQAILTEVHDLLIHISIYLCIYIYMYIYVFIFVYIYIYILMYTQNMYIDMYGLL